MTKKWHESNAKNNRSSCGSACVVVTISSVRLEVCKPRKIVNLRNDYPKRGVAEVSLVNTNCAANKSIS